MHTGHLGCWDSWGEERGVSGDDSWEEFIFEQNDPFFWRGKHIDSPCPIASNSWETPQQGFRNGDYR